MVSQKIKHGILLLVPLIALGMVVAAAVFFDSLSPLLQDPFYFPDGSDVVGAVSDVPMNHQIHYKVDFERLDTQTFRPRATLSVTVSGPASGTLQLLTPQNIVVRAKSAKGEGSLKGLHAFIIPVELQKGEEHTWDFHYELSKRASPYLLRVMPQSKPSLVSLTMNFPDENKLQSRAMAISHSKATWEGVLSRPKSFSIVADPTTEPLVVTEANIPLINTAKITLNRVPAAQSIDGGLNVIVTDLNEKNSEVTDRIFVNAVYVDGKTLMITLEGMTLQRGELYEIMLSNVRDRIGNELDPNPTILRVRQPAGL